MTDQSSSRNVWIGLNVSRCVFKYFWQPRLLSAARTWPPAGCTEKTKSRKKNKLPNSVVVLDQVQGLWRPSTRPWIDPDKQRGHPPHPETLQVWCQTQLSDERKWVCQWDGFLPWGINFICEVMPAMSSMSASGPITADPITASLSRSLTGSTGGFMRGGNSRYGHLDNFCSVFWTILTFSFM